MISPAIAGIAIGALTLVAFGGGFAVADWRKSGEIEKLRASSAMLTSANKRCATNLANVNKAMSSMLDVAIAREKAAQESMREVQPTIERKSARITRIRALPPVPVDQQCEAMKTEQIEYVQSRRNEHQ